MLTVTAFAPAVLVLIAIAIAIAYRKPRGTCPLMTAAALWQLDDRSWRAGMLAEIQARRQADADLADVRIAAVVARAWPYVTAARTVQPMCGGADPQSVWPRIGRPPAVFVPRRDLVAA